jgi:hypothetical protein
MTIFRGASERKKKADASLVGQTGVTAAAVAAIPYKS